MTRRIISVVLAVLLLLPCLSAFAFADGEGTVALSENPIKLYAGVYNYRVIQVMNGDQAFDWAGSDWDYLAWRDLPAEEGVFIVPSGIRVTYGAMPGTIVISGTPSGQDPMQFAIRFAGGNLVNPLTGSVLQNETVFAGEWQVTGAPDGYMEPMDEVQEPKPLPQPEPVSEEVEGEEGEEEGEPEPEPVAQYELQYPIQLLAPVPGLEIVSPYSAQQEPEPVEDEQPTEEELKAEEEAARLAEEEAARQAEEEAARQAEEEAARQAEEEAARKAAEEKAAAEKEAAEKAAAEEAARQAEEEAARKAAEEKAAAEKEAAEKAAAEQKAAEEKAAAEQKAAEEKAAAEKEAAEKAEKEAAEQAEKEAAEKAEKEAAEKAEKEAAEKAAQEAAEQKAAEEKAAAEKEAAEKAASEQKAAEEKAAEEQAPKPVVPEIITLNPKQKDSAPVLMSTENEEPQQPSAVKISFIVDGSKIRFTSYDQSGEYKIEKITGNDGKLTSDIPSVFAQPGYVFTGWVDKTSGNPVSPSSTVFYADTELLAGYSEISATLSGSSIIGTVGKPLEKQDISINLTTQWPDTITEGENITGWFSGIPGGLTVTTKNAGGNNVLNAEVSGTPTNASQDVVRASVPKAELRTDNNLPVTQNPSVSWNILGVQDTPVTSLTAGVVGKNSSGEVVYGKKISFGNLNKSIQIERTDGQPSYSGTTRAFYYINPNDATNQAVTFTSDDTSVALVSNAGLITPVGNGSCRIQITAAGGAYDTLEVTVSAASDMSLTAQILTGDHYSVSYLKKNEMMAVTVYVDNPDALGTRTVKWHYSSGRIALSDTKTALGYDASIGKWHSTIYVTPRYNGSVWIYASVGDRSTSKLEFKVTGLSNYPVTGQDDRPLYALIGLAVLTAGGIVFAYARRRKEHE